VPVPRVVVEQVVGQPVGQAVADAGVTVDPAEPAVRTVPQGHRREEGTDGLMGRLAFGLSDDTPLVALEMVNRFTIDDVRSTWSSLDSTPPWVRRVGGLGNQKTDPYER
jgi:hypothetical protein